MILVFILQLNDIRAENSSNPPLSFTNEESQWLAEHPVVRFSVDPDFNPFESASESGEFSGISAQYLDLISRQLGIKFEYVYSKTWDEALEKAKNREVDLLPAIARTPSRWEYLNFAAPHIISPGVILVNESIEDELTLKDLYDKEVSYVSGFMWQEAINADHPLIQFFSVPNIKSGLLKVSFGDERPLIANVAVATYYIRELGLTNIQVAGETGHFSRLSIAVRNDWPVFYTIIEKALANISEQEKDNILNEWIILQYKEALSLKEIVIFSLLIILIILIAYFWIRHLTSSIRLKRKELGESEYYNQILFKNTPIGLALTDMSGQLIEFNEAYANIIGRSIAETKQLSYWDITPKHYSNQEEAQLESLNQTGRFGPYEKEYIHKDGTLVPVRLSGLIIERNNEKFIWSCIENIHDKKKYELSLENSKLLLEEEVKLRTRKYKEAKEEADFANRAKSRFLSSMSHEFRTPLNAILGFGQLLSLDAKDEETRLNVQEIINGGNHLLNLVNGILDIAEVESGAITFSIESHNLCNLLSQCLTMVKSIADKQSIQLNEIITVDPQFCINIDEMRFKQIILNLLSNAIKYNKVGGQVSLKCSLEDNIVLLSVADTGEGMTAVQQAKVFVPFDRLGAENSNIEGSGLGLSISRNLIELMGGSIGFESTSGEGSCFWIKLPL